MNTSRPRAAGSPKPVASSAISSSSNASFPALIRFESVDFGYADSEPLLRELDLHIAPGEVVALVGATGSGKTTLTALIARFYDVTRGCIRIDGVDVRDLPLCTLRSNIGMVFEDALLFSGSIRGARGQLDLLLFERLGFGKHRQRCWGGGAG
jgi:ABC-type multidrug transport system fused ATPase/permease subunit